MTTALFSVTRSAWSRETLSRTLLFTISLPSSIITGPYLGSFSILGGADGDAQDVLATVKFEVDATAAPAAVPEPGSVWLLATGLMGLGSCDDLQAGYCLTGD